MKAAAFARALAVSADPAGSAHGGGWRMMLLLFVLALLPFPAHAQNALRVDLSGEWRFFQGDDPGFSRLEYDDSKWGRFALPRQELPPVGVSWLWGRFALPAGADKMPLALTLGTFARMYEVWCNGIPCGGTEQNADESLTARPRTFAVPAHAIKIGEPLVLAIRMQHLRIEGPFPSQLRALPDRGPYLLTDLGSAPQEAGELGKLRRERLVVVGFVVSALNALLMMLLLAAWFTDVRRQELLVLATLLGVDAGTRFWEARNIVLDAPRSASPGVLLFVSAGLLCWFAVEVFRIRKRWFTIILLSYVAAMLGMGQGVAVPVLDTGIFACSLWFARLAWRERGWRSAQLGMALSIACVAALHTQRFGVLNVVGLNRQWGGFVFPTYDVVVMLLCAGMSLHLLLSLGADRREKERLTSELEAAKTVQQLLLVPPAATSEYVVEAVYEPASQVGGDFYWTRVGDGGSLLVVVGDVSGKGLTAALLVSVVIGVLRNEESASPAKVLEAVNRALAGHTGGGFVTCCCAHFDLDGLVTMCNAGHPAPYCDGREVAVESGLPLGVVTGLTYEEFAARGERFTFVSDGVVEAENGERELFGFERTREVSGKSAREIADAAKAWGQNDDITVVTVQSTAVRKVAA